ncbi:hypothetical protein LV779_21345 [Streptomyces thinghirensis]|nr:hypothetical protein [Streptomyces thinghirensis]
MLVEAFDCWRTGKNRYDYGRFFDEWCEKDATEMVLAARNSPAVVMWSIGNEVPDSPPPPDSPWPTGSSTPSGPPTTPARWSSAPTSTAGCPPRAPRPT